MLAVHPMMITTTRRVSFCLSAIEAAGEDSSIYRTSNWNGSSLSSQSWKNSTKSYIMSPTISLSYSLSLSSAPVMTTVRVTCKFVPMCILRLLTALVPSTGKLFIILKPQSLNWAIQWSNSTSPLHPVFQSDISIVSRASIHCGIGAQYSNVISLSRILCKLSFDLY